MMAKARAQYRVIEIRRLHGKKRKVLRLERIDKPIYPKA
jgi:hypothetical protein